MNIDSAVLHGVGEPFALERVELDAPRDREVLVRIVATGICHSDLSVRDGHLPLPMPVILGHEGSGIVEAVGSGVTRVAPGDHVVLSYAYCGECVQCQSGHPVYCVKSTAMNLSGTREDGSTAYRRNGETVYGHFVGQSSFASHALVHDSATVKVSGDVPLELLAPLGCGIQTGAGTVMNQFHPPYGSSLAVTGAGTVGLSAIMAARAVGCATIIAVDVHDSRLELARELGATHTINAREGAVRKRVRKATGGPGVDFCLDTTGQQAVITEAFGTLGARGTLGIVGVSPPGTRVDLDPFHFLAGRSIRGNMEGDVVPSLFIPYLLDLHAQGRFPFDRLITNCGGLDQINDAIDAIAGGDVVKAVLTLA